ncbi:hypothetical protein JTB14_010140 [Gonioctena quinquepunctata]|nr:hypothetical protein JTB14_010140 [Gonioctena quinquepunctata]
MKKSPLTLKLLPKKNQKIYEQKFRDGWKQSRSWLENREGSSYCILCKKALSGGRVHINRHERTKFHIKRMNATNMSNKIEKVFQSDAVESDRNVKRAELQLAMFNAEHNLPFKTLEHLPKLIRNLCPDSAIAKKIKCSRTKGTQLICHYIGPENLSRVCEQLKSKHFSLIIDETTDISTCKSLAMVVRYFNGFRVTDEFLNLIQIGDGTSSTIFKVIMGFTKPQNIPENNMIVANVDPADARHFLDIDAIYFGARTETLFSLVSQADLKTFKLRAFDFLITLCQEIEKPINFKDPVLSKISTLTFHNAIKSETQPSIVPLLQCFPNLVSFNELESISSEWRLLKEYKEHFLSIGTDEEEFWKKVSYWKGI